MNIPGTPRALTINRTDHHQRQQQRQKRPQFPLLIESPSWPWTNNTIRGEEEEIAAAPSSFSKNPIRSGIYANKSSQRLSHCLNQLIIVANKTIRQGQSWDRRLAASFGIVDLRSCTYRLWIMCELLWLIVSTNERSMPSRINKTVCHLLGSIYLAMAQCSTEYTVDK